VVARLATGTGATGLEPATSGVTGRRSNQLSYAPVRRAPRKDSRPGRTRAPTELARSTAVTSSARPVSPLSSNKGPVPLPGVLTEGFVRRWAIPIALALFIAIAVVRFAVTDPRVGSISLLFILPVALLAIVEGAGAGLAGAGLAMVLLATWAIVKDIDISALDYAARAIAFGTTGGLVGWFADRARANLDALREREEALAAVSTELRDRAEELERSNADLERFAYVASHDLAEPLRTISGFTTLLGRRYKGKLDREADEFIGFIEDGTRRMQELIRALLDLSRAGQSAENPQRVDLAAALAEVLNSLHAQIRDENATVRAEGLPVVTGDAAQLRQLLQNLVANAVKFRTEKPPVVTVSARVDGDRVEVSVEDNGMGVPPEQAERIFQPFHRAAAGKEGTGIGLAVCERIVATHRGRIWVEPREEGGSVFRFTLPA
jgi:signal transduction histidine kinase